MFKPTAKPGRARQGGTVIGLKLGPLWEDLHAFLRFARKSCPKMTRQELVRQMIRYCIDEQRSQPWFKDS